MKALSAVLRTDESFGQGHLIDILRGTMTDRVRERRHDELPTFGVGRNHDKRLWQAIFRQMLGLDLVRPDPERHGALRITQKAHPVLRGEEPVQLRRDTLKKDVQRPEVKHLVSDEDEPLLSALKAKRRALAEAARVPAYIIFNDRTLIEMAETRPQTLDQMAGITGVGAKKLENYGQTFLEVIAGEVPKTHPARRRLAGRAAGALYDRLEAVQAGLLRGADGTGKYMNCTNSTLRQIAERRPATLAELARIQGMGEHKMARFGEAFLAAIQEEE
ncbi:MAG: hypothetical protein CSA73_01520 [Rhodobacterales bacterium]|nr:MAG: hypothetical protein CSA73_01520 [Rhodobacterales bacterium]